MPRPFFCTSNLQAICQDYVPTLQGATDNPTSVAYSKQSGVYEKIGNICFFVVSIVTTSMSKTTLTDTVRISLPIASASLPFTNHDTPCPAMTKNATPAKNGNYGLVPKGAQYVEIHYNPSGASAEQALTYGAADLGNLTNTITFDVSGWYFINA